MKKDKAERLLRALSDVDDEMIDAASPARTGKKPRNNGALLFRIVAIAACFAIVFGLSLYLFMPYRTTPNLLAYRGSEYYPLIEKLANKYYTPPKYKNNFESFIHLFDKPGGDVPGAVLPDYDGPVDTFPSEGGQNGSYVEVTDNQVSGVVEADIVKATDKYAFRLSYDSVNRKNYIRVFPIENAETGDTPIEAISIIELLPSKVDKAQMYLSADASRLTVITPYYVEIDGTYERKNYTRITSVDVSDVLNMSVTAEVTVSGYFKDTRMIDGRLLVVTNHSVSKYDVDYINPTTFVPTVDLGNGHKPIPMDDVVIADELSSVNYGVVTLFDENGLELIDSKALLGYTETLYSTASGVYLVNPYRKIDANGLPTDYSDIACLELTEQGIDYRGILTATGEIKDQFSLDERDGYLRVVTTTSTTPDGDRLRFGDNASLFIFSLRDMTLFKSIEYFAPADESAESVRFDGDRLYVCTALIIDPVTMTDPVYFFDLSDYENITSTDTGTIDGFSSTLIQLKDGRLLGIGRSGNGTAPNKISIYESKDGRVRTVSEMTFSGLLPGNYKAFFIDRERELLGMFVSAMSYYDEQGSRHYLGNTYLLFDIKDGVLKMIDNLDVGNDSPTKYRAFVIEEKLFISNIDNLYAYEIKG